MIENRDDIVELIAEYLWALDSCDWERLEACLLPDAVHASGSGERNGRGALIGYLRPGRESLDATQHVVTNFVVEQTRDQASVRCLLQAHHVKDGGLFSTGSAYRVAVVRAEGAWRIARIESSSLWAAGDPAVVGA
jgi:hypothetical protein